MQRKQLEEDMERKESALYRQFQISIEEQREAKYKQKKDADEVVFSKKYC